MFPKQLFYLTSDQLQAWQWRDGTLAGPDVFPATRAGVDDFLDYLDAQGPRPAWLVADMIEEDFARALLPHVRGRAGHLLRARRLAQQYRDTPLRTALVQGRSSAGRRDDVVLFTALTNPALVAPWVDALELMRTPLAGVYSTTLLSRLVLERLNVRRPHLLLVTRQSGGLRQTYFRDGVVKFSRLVQGPAAIPVETARTQQFLTSVHLLERADVLQVMVLAPDAEVDDLMARCTDTATTLYRIVPLGEAARALGTVRTADGAAPTADVLLLHALAKNTPASHYPLADKDRYYRLWRMRLSLFASSAVLTVAGLAWTVANLAGYGIATGNTDALRSETAHYRSAYGASMANMPPALDRTVNMKAAVQIDRLVAQQGPWPTRMMALVSAALEQSPQIRITQLEWRASVPGAATTTTAIGTAAGAPAVVAPVSSLALGIPKAPPQTLRLQAEVLAGQQDYRAVLESMNAFARQLAATPRVTVEIAELPFDVRSNVKLSGSAGGTAAGGEDRNKFTLDLVWTP